MISIWIVLIIWSYLQDNCIVNEVLCHAVQEAKSETNILRIKAIRIMKYQKKEAEQWTSFITDFTWTSVEKDNRLGIIAHSLNPILSFNALLFMDLGYNIMTNTRAMVRSGRVKEKFLFCHHHQFILKWVSNLFKVIFSWTVNV